MIAQFQFTPLQMSSPHDNLCAAIGMIQSYIMARDSLVSIDVMFGRNDFRSSPLETAVALLVAMVGEAESMRWEVPSSPRHPSGS